ncbi:MAG: amidohydrolase family protein [Anaerolineae bacterium]|nr:amidohydrolase family protein [Anaerolineae bacterium]
MLRIDAHIHYMGDHADCLALLERLDVKCLNVCVAHGQGDPWREHGEAYRALAAAHPERYAWCTTFDPPDFGPDYAERVIAGLEADFERGAIACKVWKNIGMDVRTPSGAFLLIDDPLFDPIYAYLAQEGRTLLMHIGEPLACWQPLDEKNLHRGYYGAHPEWHMYNKPEYPSHQDLIDARDRVLLKHPDLRVVGAHLGSLEYDVGEIARRLDRYPNFAVDSSARTRDLAHQDPEVVRAFFAAYPDRVLFGTDLVIRTSHAAMDAQERERNLQRVSEVYERESAYYEGDQVTLQDGQHVPGLGLSDGILRRFYWENAAHWYPGIA